MKKIKLGLPVKGDNNRKQKLMDKWGEAKAIIYGVIAIALWCCGILFIYNQTFGS